MRGSGERTDLLSLVAESAKVAQRPAVARRHGGRQMVVPEQVIEIRHDDDVISGLTIWRDPAVRDYRSRSRVVRSERQIEPAELAEEAGQHPAAGPNIVRGVEGSVQHLHETARIGSLIPGRRITIGFHGDDGGNE